MKFVHAIIFSLLRYCLSFTHNWLLKEGIEGSFLKLMAINNYYSFKKQNLEGSCLLTCTSFWMSQDGLIRGKKWSNG